MDDWQSAWLFCDLQTALLRALSQAWRDVNYNNFKDRLVAPVLGLHSGQSRLGLWDPSTRSLTLSRDFVHTAPWSQVVEVLKHEMVHQFVSEQLRLVDEPPHGPTFQRICAQHGIDAAAAGLPPATSGDPHPILRRISKLLALADSPNLHEAELAMKQAQRLMLKHNIEAAGAYAREGYGFRSVGEVKTRHNSAEKALASLLEKYFFVATIWMPAYMIERMRFGWVLELSGTPSNLDVAAWVHDFLLETSERLWRAHKRNHKISSNAHRREFVYGVMKGFEAKLAAGVAQTQEEGLIWRGDPQLHSYFSKRHPRIKSMHATVPQKTDAYHSGHQAGRDIVLARPVSAQSQQNGRLLTASED